MTDEIRPGQVWESRDRRPADRLARVVDADVHGAYLQHPTGGRKWWIRAATLRSRYRLIQETQIP